MTEKDRLKEAFKQGYDLGYGVEDLDDIDTRMVESRFEQWYKREYEEGFVWGKTDG